MAHDTNTIHKAVQNRYATLATTLTTNDPELSLTSVSCCDGSAGSASAGCDCGPQLYDASLLEGLPVDATGLSLGCGDPVTIAALKSGETVLDLGSGGGIDCFMAARQVGETGRVIGVDMTPEMLAQANKNRDELGMSHVEFRAGKIEALPVDDNTIDVIMSNCVINLSPDKAQVFAEAFRVLKPGGRIAVSDIVTQGDFSDELRIRLDQWSECVTGAIDAERYTDMMKQAGLTNITVVDKADAGDIVPLEEGMPRVFSARITAQKPL